MANSNAPFGLRDLGVGMGGAMPRMLPYTHAAAYATAIYPGDLVNQAADSSIEVSATPGTTYFTGVSNSFVAASTLGEVMVIIDPFALFDAQDDGTGSGTLDLDYGLNANAVLTAGTLAAKRSNHAIATSTKAVTATLDLRLIGPIRTPIGFGSEAGAYRRSVVQINKHRFTPGVVGV